MKPQLQLLVGNNNYSTTKKNLPPPPPLSPLLTNGDMLSASLQNDKEPLGGGISFEELEQYLNTTLTPIQRAIVRFMIASEVPFPTHPSAINGGRPIIADDEDEGGVIAVGMGLGKTLAILIMILRDKLLAKKYGYPSTRPFRTLVIGAPALYSVWQGQIETHFKKDALCIVQHCESKAPEKALVNSKADIIFVTYERVRLDLKQHLPNEQMRDLLSNTNVQTLRTREAYQRNAFMNQKIDMRTRLVRFPLTKNGIHSIRFWRIVIDEADALRNIKSKRLKATLALAAYNRWWVTGTPLNNSFSDIVAAMLFLRDSHVCLENRLLPDPRGLLRNIKSEHEKRARQSFERRAYIVTAQMICEDHPELIKSDPRLHYLLAPVFMFQYANQFASQEETEVYKRMQDELVSLLRELKNRNITQPGAAGAIPAFQFAGNSKQEEEHGGTDGNEIHNEHVLAYENEEEMEEEKNRVESEIEKHKRTLPPQSNTLQAAIQSVVQSANPSLSARATINYFYLRCMQAAVLPRFADKSLATNPNPVYNLESTKLCMLRMWLTTRVPKQDKVVVFSQWTTLLTAAKESLASVGIQVAEFTGSMKESERVAALKRFNEDTNCRVLLAQTRVGGIGQTFTVANWVFFLNPWHNPQVERQALSRIHRMGQLKTCYIVWLMICGTIEEIVRGNASSKMKRAEELLMSVDRQYPKVSEIYAQLTQLVMGTFQPRDGYLDYQQRESFREKFAPSLNEAVTKEEDYALLPYSEYERMINENGKRTTAAEDETHKVTRVRLSSLCNNAPLMCLLSSAAYRLSGAVPKFSTFWRVANLRDRAQTENVLFDWNRACIDIYSRTMVALRDAMTPRRMIQGQAATAPNAKQAADQLRASGVPTIEFYSATQLIERDSHLTGDYNELNLISPVVVPIGKAGSNILNQSLCYRLALDPLLMLAFLPCAQCKHFIEHQNISYSKVLLYDVVTPKQLCDDAFSPHWQLMRSAVLCHTQFTSADNDRVRLVIRSNSHDDYLTYTKTLVLPALASGSASLLTRALMSFHWAPTASRETDEYKALASLLPDDPHADMRSARNIVRRVYSAWHQSEEHGDERLVAIASALFLVSNGHVLGVFACGVSVDETLPEHVRAMASSKLVEILVQRDILCDEADLQERYEVAQITTSRGIARRPVLHLRAVSPLVVKFLSQQANVVVKDGVYETHKTLCSRTETLFDAADLARQSSAFYNATVVWESFD